MSAPYAITSPKGGACAECGEQGFSPNVEVFELVGSLVCESCAGDLMDGIELDGGDE